MVRLTAVVIAISVLAFSFYVMSGHPVSVGSLSSITDSSTQNDVRASLGDPSYVNSAGGKVRWRYTGFTWCIVTVVFGTDGKVTSVDHDH